MFFFLFVSYYFDGRTVFKVFLNKTCIEILRLRIFKCDLRTYKSMSMKRVRKGGDYITVFGVSSHIGLVSGYTDRSQHMLSTDSRYLDRERGEEFFPRVLLHSRS